MSVTAQDVFTIAMILMDEVTQDGTYDGYPEEYKKKSWLILSLLQAELIPASAAPLSVQDNTTVMQVDDRTATTVLPYGLAAQLLLTQDQVRASFFNARYDELKRKRPAAIVSIKDVIGILPKDTTYNNPTPTLSDYSGGDFLDKDSGEYDGGEF